MISNDLVQAGIVAKLKADATLVAWLTARSASNEIREAQWQGTIFTYPAVRVEMGTQLPDGNGICYTKNGETTFTVYSFSEHDSSKQSDELAGLVNTVLLGKTFTGTGFTSGLVKCDGLISATRLAERLWRATALYRVNLYGSS